MLYLKFERNSILFRKSQARNDHFSPKNIPLKNGEFPSHSESPRLGMTTFHPKIFRLKIENIQTIYRRNSSIYRNITPPA